MSSATDSDRITAVEQLLQGERLPPAAIANFIYYYRQLLAGQTGSIPESEIQPLQSLPDAEQLTADIRHRGSQIRTKTVVIKLNGGLGTSMGLDRAKSLIVVKNGYTFLDIIARQALSNGVPLLLMNSFATREDSLARLRQYPQLSSFGMDLDFLQHKVPKLDRENLLPVHHPQAPYLEWCPPGHGDIYTAMVTSGILARLRAAGYRYAFISNADNLGAELDESILGYMVRYECPFLMEVTDRTEADKKGGHLTQRTGGGLLLREAAQCPAGDSASFQDITRHKYFNTNNLWLDLAALQAAMEQRGNILGLPLICNAKPVDPRDERSTPVYQLETAMGAAISVFAGARAIRVPRSRFAPVKTTNDLFVVRSDAYLLTPDFRLLPARTGSSLPVIDLDGRYFKLVEAFEQRLPSGIPALAECRSLKVIGDVKFGSGIRLSGDVIIRNGTGKQVLLADNSVLTGEVNFQSDSCPGQANDNR